MAWVDVSGGWIRLDGGWGAVIIMILNMILSIMMRISMSMSMSMSEEDYSICVATNWALHKMLVIQAALPQHNPYYIPNLLTATTTNLHPKQLQCPSRAFTSLCTPSAQPLVTTFGSCRRTWPPGCDPIRCALWCPLMPFGMAKCWLEIWVDAADAKTSVESWCWCWLCPGFLRILELDLGYLGCGVPAPWENKSKATAVVQFVGNHGLRLKFPPGKLGQLHGLTLLVAALLRGNSCTSDYNEPPCAKAYTTYPNPNA